MHKKFPIKAYNHKILILGIVLLFCVVFFTLSKSFSETRTSSVWDGTIATSFATGTGTYDEPYEITNGGEFVYFLSLLSGEGAFTSEAIIMNNIDFNGYDLSNYVTGLNSYAGHIDGNCYTLSNFTINNPKEHIDGYSLLGSLDNAIIENISFDNISITASEEKDVSLIATNIANTTIRNINISNFTITSTYETTSGIFNNDLGANSIYDINIDLTSTNGNIITNNYTNSNITNIMYKASSLPLINTEDELTNIYSYTISEDNIVFDNTSTSEVLEVINYNNEITWDITGTDITMISANTSFMDELIEPTPLANVEINAHTSGISGTIVYVNDLDADYYYYMGLNYTESHDGKLPSTDNKNYYNDSNLVKVQMTYNASDIKNEYTGTVSTTENQNKYVYYKYYVVNTNGTSATTDDYIEVELIDNPFTNRPTDTGFNGWITPYPNAIVSLNTDKYLRYVKIPITYTNTNPNNIVIDMYASWIPANIGYASGSFGSSFVSLPSETMQRTFEDTPIYSLKNNINMNNYYTQTSVSWGRSKSGYYESNGSSSSGTCYTWGGCTVYRKMNGTTYSDSTTYYKLVNGSMSVVNNQTEFYEITGYEPYEGSTALPGLFKKVSISRNQSITGYYSVSGVLQESGTCNSSTCTYYELIQYSADENGVIEDDGGEYYYLATRDTNIVVLNSNTSGVFSNISVPFTLTSVYNGTDYRNSAYWNIGSNSITLNSDVTIENIKVYTTTNPTSSTEYPSGSGGSRTIYGNWYNLKLGRGITKNGNYINFSAFVGGSSSGTGSSSNVTNYTLRVESGLYQSGALAAGNSGGTDYIHAYGYYGTDYDRVNNNNDLLVVRYCAAGSFGGNIYGATNIDPALMLTVKSGQFGSNKYDYSTGIYVGGQQYGTHHSPRSVVVEGGYIYNLIGGPLAASSQETYNDTYMYIKGGTISNITGGAGRSATYGNRIIQVTGGKVEYGVFGGSNGYKGSDGDGTLKGTPYVYIGGSATIGDDTLITNDTKLYDLIESGSVFGIGNGKSGTSEIGSADNSNVIIDGNALIKQNVYGGGNYGATGISSSGSTNTTTIKMLGGTVTGAIYGAGNNNGAGSTSNQSTINIYMNGGTVGDIYGGSKALGTVYGNVNINVLKGTINNIYGGGEGGYNSGTSAGTYVSKNINVNIGNSTEGPTINGNIYGGSAYGTVNATVYTEETNDYETNITVNKGTITGSIFGGAKGSNTITPYVKGNIKVTINDGLIGSVYGGFDQSGSPEGTSNVYLNGGTIGSVFGGGNYTNISASNIHEQGATINYLYGGSNNSGTVTTSNINMTSGTVGYVYGGNNLGGKTTTANTTINGGTINSAIYGGGNQAEATTTNLTLNSVTNTIPLVVGGDKSASSNKTTIISSVNVTNMYGGSDNSGTVNESNITINTGNVTNIYGGNNLGGKTVNSNIKYINGTTSLLYGGGNNAPTDNTSIEISGGTITTLFGGGNEGATGTTTITSTNTRIDNLYGGGNNASTTSSNIDITNGTYTNIFGGGNNGQITNTEVLLRDGTVTNLYGGGNNASTQVTSLTIDGGVITDVYGGGNLGEATTTEVLVNDGAISELFGGGNKALAQTTSVEITSGVVNSAYGGGNEGNVTTSNIKMNGATAVSGALYGGGKSASVNTTNVDVVEGTAGVVFGGSNQSGTIGESNIDVGGGSTSSESPIAININTSKETWTERGYKYIIVVNVDIVNNTDYELSEYEGKVIIPLSTLQANYSSTEITETNGIYSFNQVNRHYGLNKVPAHSTHSFQFKVYTNSEDSEFVTTSKIKGVTSNGTNYESSGKSIIKTIFGGNNLGGSTGNTNININNGELERVYGGGNEAIVTGNTEVTIASSTVEYNIYGGGNEGIVKGNTEVLIESSTIKGSAYAGGNGSTATVEGNSTIYTGGTTVIGTSTCTTLSECSLFGGGNAAQTGQQSTNNSRSKVNIKGATIYGNVYGGANTSVVYGIANVTIGADATTKDPITKGNIYVKGTVFGGGEANASGSEIFDFNFISVTTGIEVNINALNYTNFRIDGSIFGSGNASSTTGTSVINIDNYGLYKTPKQNISIQRADVLNMSNSSIKLSGATDRTNEYKQTEYALSRITTLNLKNNSTLYLEKGANLLKVFNSLTSSGDLAEVTINENTGVITKNVDNRVYLLPGENLNVQNNEQNTEYGVINGMTFFGLFKKDNNNIVNIGGYDKYETGEFVSLSAVFESGSYVMGLHKGSHDITKDGFYTNYVDEETNTVEVKYVNPTPDNTQFYQWVIGEQVVTYEVDLIASKLSTIRGVELAFINEYEPNTSFQIVGFDASDIAEGVSLVDKNNVPRIALNSEAADTTMALSMQSGYTGWLTTGETNFVTDERLYTGTTEYIGENSSKVPSMIFYLNHSKNISTSGKMGTVRVVIMVVTKESDIKNKIRRIVVNVNLSRQYIEKEEYDSAIAPGRKYEPFSPVSTSITSTSTFSSYFSLFVPNKNIYKYGYKHTLITDKLLPVNTKMTLIDLSGSTPTYYYHIISEADNALAAAKMATEHEALYDFSMFELMGTQNSGQYYNDSYNNNLYYDSTTNSSSEEFIFIVDFKDTNITSNQINNLFSMELLDQNDETIINIAGETEEKMYYSIYATDETPLVINGTSSVSKIYPGDDFTIDLSTVYEQLNINSVTVYDTKLFEEKMGIKISFINPNGQVVSGTSLLGLYYEIDGEKYYPNIDGTTRIKLSDKVGDIRKWITVHTGQSNMSSGIYQLRIEAFSSPDGIFYGLDTLSEKDIPLQVINEIYGLDINTTNKKLVIDSATGFNMEGNNYVTYDITYNSALTNPNIHIKLYRRLYDSTYSTSYEEVDLKDYVSNYMSEIATNEYLIVNNPNEETTLNLLMKDNLLKGTYKVEFILCDESSPIGTVEKYIIIK